MTQMASKKAPRRPCWRFNPLFAEFSNEDLYEALCAATAPLDAGLKELQDRMKPIIIDTSRAFLKVLSWTFDDAMSEGLILLWDLVRKHSFKWMGTQFHSFFKNSFINRLNGIFYQTVQKSLVLMNNYIIGYKNDEPVYACGYAFHPKGKEYREKQNAYKREYAARKRAEKGIQPKKPPMTAEEKREKARLQSKARFDALTPEEKRARYDRENAARRAKRAAETPEEKAARKEREKGYREARKARMAAQAALETKA